MVLRKAMASRMLSWVRLGPEAPSIIAVETSFEAMMAYCGEVEACIMKASLKRSRSIGRRPWRTWIIEAWLSAASSLCVDCVVSTVGPLTSPGSRYMP